MSLKYTLIITLRLIYYLFLPNIDSYNNVIYIIDFFAGVIYIYIYIYIYVIVWTPLKEK